MIIISYIPEVICMPFLLRTPEHFILVENRPRQGLFYQIYTKDSYPKPNLIHPFPTDNYAATLDNNANLHLITESSKNQILYVHFDKGIPTKKIVLEDPNHYYMFKHLSLQSLDDNLYLIYSVKHPTGNVRSLMYQPLKPSALNLSVLIQSIPDNCIVKILSTPNKLYIVYTDFDSSYQIKLVTLSASGTEHMLIYSSSLPITDFNCCLSNHILHITYIKDAYGKQQLSYINTKNLSELLLDMPHQVLAPSIFNYLNFLWITYPYGDKLFMLLSTNNGNTFSIPVPTSLQGVCTSYTYSGVPEFELNATSLYGLLSSPLRLGVISAIDLKGIHPDLQPASELELLLEGMRFSGSLPHTAVPQAPTTLTQMQATLTPKAAPPPIPFIEPYTVTQQPTSPIEPISMPSPSKDLKSATKAFMDAQNAFDAQPK